MKKLLLTLLVTIFSVAVVNSNSNINQEQRSCENLEFYEDLIEQEKMKPDSLGLTMTLLEIHQKMEHSSGMLSEEESAIYDKAIRFFVARGCDLNQSFEMKNYLETALHVFGREQDELALKNYQESKLCRCLCAVRKTSLLEAVMSLENLGLSTVLLKHDVKVNGLAGVGILFKYGVEYDAIQTGFVCTSCIPNDYVESLALIVKKSYQGNNRMIQTLFLKIYPGCAQLLSA